MSLTLTIFGLLNLRAKENTVFAGKFAHCSWYIRMFTSVFSGSSVSIQAALLPSWGRMCLQTNQPAYSTIMKGRKQTMMTPTAMDLPSPFENKPAMWKKSYFCFLITDHDQAIVMKLTFSAYVQDKPRNTFVCSGIPRIAFISAVYSDSPFPSPYARYCEMPN